MKLLNIIDYKMSNIINIISIIFTSIFFIFLLYIIGITIYKYIDLEKQKNQIIDDTIKSQQQD
jgi:phage shock protein PspC (stress-responsive transcriptional regulator)